PLSLSKWLRHAPSSLENWLDVDDRGAVDRFDGPDAKPSAVDLAHDDRMKPERVRPIRGSRREDACERIARIGSWMDLHHVAPRAVKPGDHDDLVASGEAKQRVRSPRMHMEPGVWCAFRSLSRRLAARLQCRSDDTDRPEPAARHL